MNNENVSLNQNSDDSDPIHSNNIVPNAKIIKDILSNTTSNANENSDSTNDTLNSKDNKLQLIAQTPLNEAIELLDHSNNIDSNPNSYHSNDSNQDILPTPNQSESSINDEIIQINNNSPSSEQIQLKDIWNYFTETINVKMQQEAIIVEDFAKGNLFKRFFIQCSNDYKLLPGLKKERLLIFSIAKCPYDTSNELHSKCLYYIYKFLLQQNNPKKYDWELIGFQGDPQNDFRSVGMMGVIQMIALIDSYPVFTLEFFDYLESIQSEWIFAILLLNMTKLGLDLLKKGILITYCNKKKKVLETLNRFFFGLVYQLNKELLSENDNIMNVDNRLTIDYISNLILHIQNFAQQNPGHFFWNESQLLETFPSKSLIRIDSPNAKEIDKFLK